MFKYLLLPIGIGYLIYRMTLGREKNIQKKKKMAENIKSYLKELNTKINDKNDKSNKK